MTIIRKVRRWVPMMKAIGGSIDSKTRTLRAVITTNDVDRDGEIIEPKAFKKRIDTFLDNPVLLWMHDPRQAPIGSAKGIEFFDDRIEADLQFRAEGKSAIADEAWGLYEDGTLKSFSIGFRIFEVEESTDEETGRSLPPRITDGELLEISAVSIPANPNAIAKHFGAATLLQKGLDILKENGLGSLISGGKSGKLVPTADKVFAPLDELSCLRTSTQLLEDIAKDPGAFSEAIRDARSSLILKALVSKNPSQEIDDSNAPEELMTALKGIADSLDGFGTEEES